MALQGAPEEDAFAVHQYGVAFMMLSAALRLMRVDHLDVQTILFEVDALAPRRPTRRSQARPSTTWRRSLPMVDVLAAVHVGRMSACS